jgi:DNA-binding NarL/FixJ family response regulator
VLSLIVAGVPDKSIASLLQISRHTVQRRLDRMMVLAGVDTRTGLGVPGCEAQLAVGGAGRLLPARAFLSGYFRP